jgi:hypothetical protein
MMSEIRATLQLVSEGTGCLLQHMQPATVFITDWASIRATRDSNTRGKAGYLSHTKNLIFYYVFSFDIMG